MKRDPLADRVDALNIQLDKRDREIDRLRKMAKEVKDTGNKGPDKPPPKKRGRLDRKSASHSAIQGGLAAPAQALVDFFGRLLVSAGFLSWFRLYEDQFIQDYIAAPIAMAIMTLLYQLTRKF